MDESENANLDVEFKRYLQIMRPYLEKLQDQDVIEICKAWIQRLSNCSDNEKFSRNKYVFALCYQLAKGVLDVPFLKFPSEQELPPLSDETDSDASSTEIEYIVINSQEEKTRIIFDNKQTLASDTDFNSQGTKFDNKDNIKNNQNESSLNEEEEDLTYEQNNFLYNCPEITKSYEPYQVSCEEYKYRANNLVIKLREIKTQNMLLQKELEILKQELKVRSNDINDSTIKVNQCTSCCYCYDKCSSSTHDSLKTKSQEKPDSKNHLLQTVDQLQEKLNNFEEMKRNEIEELEASHKMELIKSKTATREEAKNVYENKIKEIQQHYEMTISNIQNKFDSEKHELVTAKDRVISEKEQIINAKDNEIVKLKNLNDDQKSHLQEVISKFLEKPNEGTSCDSAKYRAEQLEKRLNKMEKSKTKCTKVFESKLAHMQREKHLAECSLQIQLARQRAQVVKEVTDENQTELNAAINKLESKYKEIVGNMQATAIQRRVQDQMAIESILNAACGIRNEGYTNCSQGTNRSQFSGKTMQNQNRNQMNRSYDTEISALLNGNKVDSLIGGNKSLGEDSVMGGYCLDGERMGELFERVYIPQRDIGDGPSKK